MVRWGLVGVILVGCSGDERRPGAKRWQADRVELVQAPRAADDPLWIAAEGSEGKAKTTASYSDPLAEPVVVGAAGDPVAVEAVDWHGTVVGYRPVGGWSAGEHTVVGAAGREPVDEPVSFTVGPWGFGDVDPDTLVGTSWQVVDGWTAPGDVADVLLELGDLTLTVESVEAEGVVFSLMADAGGGPCVVLADLGSWEGSSLSWEEPGMAIPASPEPIWVEDLALAVHFDGATPDEASGQLRALADADAIEQDGMAEPDPGVVCDNLGAFGMECVPCGDGLECAGAPVYAMALQRVTPLVGDFPVCGITPLESPDIPPLTCEIEAVPIDCGCDATRTQQGAIPLWVALLTVLGRRRRRSLRRPAGTTG